MTGREAFVAGALTVAFLVFVAWIVVRLGFGWQAIECTDDHRLELNPLAMRVSVENSRRSGHIVAWELPFDCTAFSYDGPPVWSD